MALLRRRHTAGLFKHVKFFGFAEAAARNLVEEIWASLPAAAKKYDSRRGSFRNWLYKSHAWAEIKRAKGAENRYHNALEVCRLQNFEAFVSPPPHPVDYPLRAALEAALRRLRPRERQLIKFLYFWVPPLQKAEVAERLNLEVPEVKRLEKVALRQLRFLVPKDFSDYFRG
ncbi:sigma factor-like helix-turn-helix DNA-binding protein [Gloeobacter morelensis]|uniref:sigma factor-like helix-turn-helix DNA-binding protein n=1 Tax=Gloeobacter morelensis TaxID=2907343 RepID=UPI001E314D87|nr:sigma factor-like helix-turn-helix DNA-binding protein [Gloeobacter morelensis]UFP97164.1 hypothetical protein ISF26_23880 [Gloeobacter morelensis MG652769]